MQCIYEVGLAGRIISVKSDVWENIRSHVRNGKWFVIVYMNKRYRYVGDKTYYDRPTRFDFEISSEEDEKIDVIYL